MRHIQDLSQRIHPNLPVYPGSPSPEIIKWSNYEVHGYESEVIFMSTHTGTHIDCPSHFIPFGLTIDKIEADRFYSSAILIRTEKGPGNLISVDDISQYQIKDNAAIVIATGWESRQNTPQYMENYPGLSKDAAEYIVSLKPNLVAIDSPSIDSAENPKFDVHKILLSRNILIVENVCNLDNLPVYFDLVVTPILLQGVSGSPARAFGIIKDQNQDTS